LSADTRVTPVIIAVRAFTDGGKVMRRAGAVSRHTVLRSPEPRYLQ